jgi:aminoglycoside phosphotransferase (APT) family kinase protein
VDDEIRRRVEALLGARGAAVVEIEEGWDSSVFEIDGTWIVRVPRRDEVREDVRAEARLLPELAAALPVAVPRFEIVEDARGVFFVAYRKLAGDPLVDPPAALAPQVAAFLAALHSFPPERASKSGIESRADIAERCRREVFPLLAADERRRAGEMFALFLSEGSPEEVLVHGDLGPAHLLHRGLEVTGVIDWSDAALGDPAIDFAWLLHGTCEPFAAGLLETYASASGPDPGLRRRALLYHRLGPWHEVLYGLKHGRPELVESGLMVIRARLP